MFYMFVIKEVRKSKGVSLIGLARMTNLSRAYICDLESNRRSNPTFSALYKIANALEVNTKDLFYTIDDIDYLKETLDKTIEEYGLQSKRVAEISKIIDTLVTHELKEKKNLNNKDCLK